jgi:phage shock protein E
MLKYLGKSIFLLLVLALSATTWAGEEIYWIDVRSASEFASGHVEGAVNIPHTEIVARIGEVTDDKDATLYLYCRSGRRSGAATDALQQAGFVDVVNVGGLDDALKRAAATDDGPEEY